MRALVVELLAPQFQALLIDVAQTLKLQTDVAMQAFVGPIVLRMSGAASFQINAQGNPPGRKSAQSVHRTHRLAKGLPLSLRIDSGSP